MLRRNEDPVIVVTASNLAAHEDIKTERNAPNRLIAFDTLTPNNPPPVFSTFAKRKISM